MNEVQEKKKLMEFCPFVCGKVRVTGTVLRLHNSILLIIVFEKLLHFYLMTTAMPTVNQ